MLTSAGTLCDDDNELFIKPCTQAEIDFYQEAEAHHTEFADWMPIFMGTLMLSAATDVEDINEQLPAVADIISEEMKEAVVEMAHENAARAAGDRVRGKALITDRAIVLENTAFGYVEPNIMDVKMGRRLWADDASEEKKKRFDKIRYETTHEQFGFRIAGMRVYKGSPNEKELDREGYKIYGKDWGRVDVNADNIITSFRKYIFNSSAKIDDEVGRAVARAFKTDLVRIRDVLERQRTRMYSASLLFVFEGDGTALRAAIEGTSAGPTAAEKVKGTDSRSNYRVDSGIDLDEDGELIPHTAEGGDDDQEDDEPNQPRIYGVKLIDFAHAQFVPDQEGPDENVLHGVRHLIEIFDKMSK
jgi:inositol-polyphosphate multikinase